MIRTVLRRYESAAGFFVCRRKNVGAGRVRLIEVLGYDLQPCGGTHVRSTAEIGNVRVTQIGKKGKLNRRVRIAFA